jgi:hypothetical protein
LRLSNRKLRELGTLVVGGLFLLGIKLLEKKGNETLKHAKQAERGAIKDFLKQAWAECFAAREILAKWDIKEPNTDL